jgi:hypothetical protein
MSWEDWEKLLIIIGAILFGILIIILEGPKYNRRRRGRKRY